MKNLIRSIYMSCLLFALQIPVEAATIEEVLAYCRAQAEADKRLACFEELARAVAEGEVLPTLPSSGTGRWNVTQEVSPIDDSREVSMVLWAEDVSLAALVVRCREGKIEVLVGFDSRLKVEGDNAPKIEVLSRFDRHPAQKNYWGFSTNNKAIFAPHSAFWALKIERAQKLFVRLTPLAPSEANLISATFDLTGTAEAMRPLRDSCGFNVNAKNELDETALHVAISENALELADLLLTHGADVNAKTAAGGFWGGDGTVLHVAVSENVVRMSENALEKVDLLLTHGADVNAKMVGFSWGEDRGRVFFDGWTALHSAASKNALEVVSLLLTHGADVNAKDKDGKTALSWALREGHTEMADLLRRHGGKNKGVSDAVQGANK